jgi:exo-1,4-beta-D-glucosaminidase
MLNSAWPSFYWQLYDYYLLPVPAYYAARKANAPMQLIYNYGNHSIYAVNETLERLEKAKARIRMFDLEGNELVSDELVINLKENASTSIYKVPQINSTVFLSMSLLDNRSRVIADNFYWLPGKPDVYDWEKTEWYYTPISASADFRSLSYLPAATVELNQKATQYEHEQVIETTIRNTSGKVAFFMNFAVKDSSGHTVYPAFWDDNYLSLLPGETRSLKCTIPGDPAPGGYTLTLSGWNVKEQQIHVAL